MIELTTHIIMLASLFYGSATTTPADIAPIMEVDAPRMETATDDIKLPMTLEKHVREYFKDTPVLARIAYCESTFRQYMPDGKVIRGEVNSKDVGVMQINEKYHADKAEELGFDLNTIDGNLAYAKWLYGHYGSAPWSSSSKCWKSKVTPAAPTPVPLPDGGTKHLAKA